MAVLLDQRGELLPRGELGRLHARLVDPAFGKIFQAEADAAHVQRLGKLRLEAGADDELRGAAADVDHQAPLGGFRQRVRNAQVDQARFLAAGDHLDRKAERGARLAQELRRILRHAQRVGADHAHRRAREAAQALAELGERFQRARLGGAIDALFGGQPGAQAHHLAHRVEGIDLAVDHATDLQVEAVGAKVDRGQRVVTRHWPNLAESIYLCTSLSSSCTLLWRTSFPIAANTTCSPMFLAWSPMRSSDLATNRMSRDAEIVRGSSTMMRASRRSTARKPSFASRSRRTSAAAERGSSASMPTSASCSMLRTRCASGHNSPTRPSSGRPAAKM